MGVFIQAGQGVMQNIHSSLGLILLGLLGAQIITGALTKNYQQSGTAKPETMFKLKKIHQIIGFSIIVITKFNILNNRNSTITFVLILVF
jgi:cytochrome b561